MEILEYNELNILPVKKQYEKIVEMIRRDDFYSANVKKISGTPYYRAKLDYANRLLLRIVEYQRVKYALLLEVILNHEYNKSRFLRSAEIDESKIEQSAIDLNLNVAQEIPSLSYINPINSKINIIDKYISFDNVQAEIYSLKLPIMLIGSAGSGKTTLVLEKLKNCYGEVLYVTGSSFLVENSRAVYYTDGYNNEYQELDFLSYHELLETLEVLQANEITLKVFSSWLISAGGGNVYRDSNKLFEEFKGVISGNTIDKPYLSRIEYENLGVKQSIYQSEERRIIYDLFEKYVLFLKQKNLYDINLISYEYLSKCTPKYDFIIIDEVQDFTPIQLFLILKLLKQPHNFILCGDSNQIVHPNFFSWAKIKSLFYNNPIDEHNQFTQILNKNYRNASAITAFANKILKIKNVRFGSIDRESNYLVESYGNKDGEIYCLQNTSDILNELNTKSKKSTRFAIIVLREEDKIEAKKYFQTPLVFSIFEAKGLEYDHVILYNLISGEDKNFRDIAEGVSSTDLTGGLVYRRAKDKTDKSLEIYKFYINALYVAVTRAIKKIYMLESLPNHKFLNLFALRLSTDFTAIVSPESSLDEWQHEMRKLELQGKTEQAEAIRTQMLQTHPVPWQVLDNEELHKLKIDALNEVNKNKAARLLLFEYALVYKQEQIIHELAKVGFQPALRSERNYELLNNKYFMGYNSSNTASVMRLVDKHGIEFRNQFNYTSLMSASRFGNSTLINQLLERGADVEAANNAGFSSFHIALQEAFLDKKFAQNKFLSIYQVLATQSISIHVENKLVKLDNHRIEYILVNSMMILIHMYQMHEKTLLFNVDMFLDVFKHIPEQVISANRKKRAYLSSILAKNEIDREDMYNKKLFVRVKRGFYVLNSVMKVKVGTNWIQLL